MSIVDRELDKVQGRKLTQGELAASLDVTRDTVHDWQQLGMPYERRAGVGDENVYDLGRVVTWLLRREIAKASGGETQKDRLARVQADRIELEIAEKTRRLVDVDQFDRELGRAVAATRVMLLQIPPRLAGALEATAGVESKRRLLEEEIEDALRNLSAYDPSTDPDPSGVEAVRPAGADDRCAVGGAEALSL